MVCTVVPCPDRTVVTDSDGRMIENKTKRKQRANTHDLLLPAGNEPAQQMEVHNRKCWSTKCPSEHWQFAHYIATLGHEWFWKSIVSVLVGQLGLSSRRTTPAVFSKLGCVIGNMTVADCCG